MPLIRKLFSNRLQERFDLEGLPEEKGESWYMPKQIFPVTNIDPLLRTTEVLKVVGISATATGWQKVFSVSVGERWTLVSLHVIINAVNNLARFNYLGFEKRGDTEKFYIDKFTATNERLFRTGLEIPRLTLNEEDKLYINISTADAADTFDAYIIYEREDVF